MGTSFFRWHCTFLVAALLLGSAFAAEPLITWERSALETARERIRSGDEVLLPAFEALVRTADRALEEGPWTVTEKPFTPPSGDKRDYMSVGPYWWPNPDTEDGLPYIRRDGETNPERHEYDNNTMGQMRNAVRPLILAWYFTGEERYAERAAKVLRVWFLDEDTRMNPHLEYGQAIPGRTEGRDIGIIDTVMLCNLMNELVLLRGADSWSAEDDAALREWFSDYLRWLLESGHGKSEGSRVNNHGTWYDAQVVAYALFTGEEATARSVLEKVGERRVAVQIAPDGRQPHELGRTRAYSYTVYNLMAFTDLAMMGRHVGVDVWNYESEDGRSIRRALEWFAPYAANPDDMPYEQIVSPNLSGAWWLYRVAAEPLGVPEWRELAMEIGPPGPDHYHHLILLPE